MQHSKATLLFLPVLTLLLLPQDVRACSCVGTWTGIQPCQAYWDSGAVFIGLVTDITTPRTQVEGNVIRIIDHHRVIHFTVEEAFRGLTSKTVKVLTGMGGGDCGYSFRPGERYFVYAHGNSENNLSVSICGASGRTRPLTQAPNDLEYARNVARGMTGASVFGVVLRYTRDSYVDYGRHKGVEGVPVAIEGKTKSYNLLTNDEGRFQSDGLPAGTYTVRAELPGNLSKAPEQQITVVEGRCGGVAFLTTSLGTIKGRLLNFEGRPASKIAITLIPAKAEGNEGLWKGREISSYTDGEGRYRFGGVPPGRYVIAVNHEGQPGQFDPPYPRTYHLGTSNLSQATVITISEGQELEAEDLRLPPKLVERTIEGVVEWPDGRPAVGATVGLEYAERQWMEQLRAVDDQGRFSLKCFEGYRYLVHADHGGEKRMHAEPVEILVTGESQPVKLVITKPGRSPYFHSRKQKRPAGNK